MGGAGLLLVVVAAGAVLHDRRGVVPALGAADRASLRRSRGAAAGEQHPLARAVGRGQRADPRPALGIAMVMFGLGITIGAGMFIPAAPTLVGSTLEAGPGSYGLIMLGFGVGAIAVAVRAVPGRGRPPRSGSSVLFWVGYPACFVLFALAGNLAVLVFAAALAGAAESGARILLVSAMQHQIGPATLGRAMSVFFTVHRATPRRRPAHRRPAGDGPTVDAGAGDRRRARPARRRRQPGGATAVPGSSCRSWRVAPAT